MPLWIVLMIYNISGNKTSLARKWIFPELIQSLTLTWREKKLFRAIKTRQKHIKGSKFRRMSIRKKLRKPKHKTIWTQACSLSPSSAPASQVLRSAWTLKTSIRRQRPSLKSKLQSMHRSACAQQKGTKLPYQISTVFLMGLKSSPTPCLRPIGPP